MFHVHKHKTKQHNTNQHKPTVYAKVYVLGKLSLQEFGQFDIFTKQYMIIVRPFLKKKYMIIVFQNMCYSTV